MLNIYDLIHTRDIEDPIVADFNGSNKIQSDGEIKDHKITDNQNINQVNCVDQNNLADKKSSESEDDDDLILYERGPHIGRENWNKLGDMIIERENQMFVKGNAHLANQSIKDEMNKAHESNQNPPCGEQCKDGNKIDTISKIPSDKTFAMRLDIRGMSRIKSALIKLDVLKSRWDPDFAYIMRSVTESLSYEFHSKFSYTQSDEITLIIVPPVPIQTESESTDRLSKYQHPFNGRYQKLISLSAAMASTEFMRQLYLFAIYKSQGKMNMETLNKIPLVHFDCRISIWDNVKDAFQLVLWRSYDCGLNGISDAVYNLRGSLKDESITNSEKSSPENKYDEENDLNSKSMRASVKEVMKLGSCAKLQFLKVHNQLPLPDHQAYGTLFERQKVKKSGFNPKTQKEESCERNCIVQREAGNIINMVKYDEITFD